MKTMVRILLLSAMTLGIVTLFVPPSAEAAPPDRTTVTLQCQNGWAGSAVGTYGGVSFGIACNNGRSNLQLTGTSGTAYSVRMGAESAEVAVDCFFTGDSASVSEACAGVRILIH